MPRRSRLATAAHEDTNATELITSDFFRVEPTGLAITGTPPFDQFDAFFSGLMRFANASMWAMGDAIVYGESRADWGEMYTQAIDLTQRSYSTMANAASVCRKFARERRRVSLSFTHHAEVAGLSEAQQDLLLDEAERSGLPASDLRARVKELRDAANASLRAVDDGGTREVAAIQQSGTVRLIITCPDEEIATSVTMMAMDANAIVERVQ